MQKENKKSLSKADGNVINNKLPKNLIFGVEIGSGLRRPKAH